MSGPGDAPMAWDRAVLELVHPVLVYDGACPFCLHFAELSLLRSGIPGLAIRDGRRDVVLRRALRARGHDLARGAVLLEGGRIHHGAAAIQWICAQMEPTAPLLQVLAPLFADPDRARRVYPLLLLARRLALAVRGVPQDPDAAP